MDLAKKVQTVHLLQLAVAYSSKVVIATSCGLQFLTGTHSSVTII